VNRYRPDKLRKLAVTLVVIFGTALCAAQVQAQEVLVFAASSLTDALGAIAAKYEQGSHDHIVLSFASSSALARQIESGAPADIYASADANWMDYLEQQNLIRARTRRDLVGNQLVLIAPQGSRLKPTRLTPGFPMSAWLGDGRLAMGNPEHVPAGIYGEQALKFLRVWKSLRRDVAGAEDVRAALALVALGEVPLGIVYRTDALMEDAVKIIGTFPERSHAPIVYPIALTTQGKDPAARAFFGYMTSAKSKAVFERHGFKMLH
jgi:molybdate transport system substrate-binding protein